MSIVAQTKEWLAETHVDTGLAELVNQRKITVRDLMCAVILRARDDEELMQHATLLLDSVAIDIGLMLATLCPDPRHASERFVEALAASIEMHSKLNKVLN